MQPLAMLTVPPEGVNLNTWPSLPNEGKTFTGLKHQLPMQVHIPTLEWWGTAEKYDCPHSHSKVSQVTKHALDNYRPEVLVRFEHIFDKHDKVGDLASPVSFELTKDLFNGFSIDSAQEMLLGGDRSKDEQVNSLPICCNNVITQQIVISLQATRIADGVNVVLQPFEIKTYKLSISYQ